MLPMNNHHSYYANMDVDDIRIFIALATTRSFSRAAQELFLTQPAVTRRLQRLEHELGATLVDRRRRPLALTAAGLAALEKSQKVLDGLSALHGVVHAGSSLHREFRIGVAHALTEFALVEPVEIVHRQFPHLALMLSTGWSRGLVAMARTGHLDAAFVLLPAEEKLPYGVEGLPLARERLVPITSRGTSRLPRTLRDLDGAEWILNPEGCAARASLLQSLERENVRSRVAVETYTYETQVALVARGRGFGLVPQRLLLRSGYRANVRAIPIQGLYFPLKIWSIHRSLPADLSVPLEHLSVELRTELNRAVDGHGGDAYTRRSRSRPVNR